MPDLGLPCDMFCIWSDGFLLSASEGITDCKRCDVGSNNETFFVVS